MRPSRCARCLKVKRAGRERFRDRKRFVSIRSKPINPKQIYQRERTSVQFHTGSLALLELELTPISHRFDRCVPRVLILDHLVRSVYMRLLDIYAIILGLVLSKSPYRIYRLQGGGPVRARLYPTHHILRSVTRSHHNRG